MKAHGPLCNKHNYQSVFTTSKFHEIIQDKLSQCEEIRDELVSSKAALNQDIRIKQLSLNIDCGKCLPARIKFPHNQR